MTVQAMSGHLNNSTVCPNLLNLPALTKILNNLKSAIKGILKINFVIMNKRPLEVSYEDL
jgi:hypothetical protein